MPTAASDAPGFSDAEHCALACALDLIIPARADRHLPGAGALGVGRAVDAALRATPELRAMVAQSLAALDAGARAAHGRPFTELDAATQAQLAAELSCGEHALPPAIILHTYAAYYAHPRVLDALGLPPRPPHPHGYVLAPSDLDALLAPVRARGQRYRDA